MCAGYVEKLAAAPPVNIYQSQIEVASDYTKKKHVLRLKLHDGAEFLIEAPSLQEMTEWHRKVTQFAGKCTTTVEYCLKLFLDY